MKKLTCKICNLELDYKSFKKYDSKNNKFEPGLQYHSICRKCEEEIKYKENWKDGLLKCHICGEYFPEETFHKIGSGEKKYGYRNGRDNRCPTCKLNNIRKCRSSWSDDEKLKKLLHHRLLGAKTRALKKKIDFNLTKEFLMHLWNTQKGKCALTGLDMTYKIDNGRSHTNVSIDRIDSDKGYTIDNIQLVCMAVNQMKSDLTNEELMYFCNNIIKWNKKKKK